MKYGLVAVLAASAGLLVGALLWKEDPPPPGPAHVCPTTRCPEPEASPRRPRKPAQRRAAARRLARAPSTPPAPPVRRAPPAFPREQVLASLAQQARTVGTCFETVLAPPRLHVRMALAPDGRVASVDLQSARATTPEALKCARERLERVRLGPLPIDRMETVVWALDLADKGKP